MLWSHAGIVISDENGEATHARPCGGVPQTSCWLREACTKACLLYDLPRKQKHWGHLWSDTAGGSGAVVTI